MSLQFKIPASDSPERAQADPSPSEDATFLDLLAYMDAASRPRHELVEDALATLMRLRKTDQLTSEEMAVLVNAIVAANIGAVLNEVISRALAQGNQRWLVSAGRKSSAGSWSLFHHRHPAPE